jgi:hypothetical protein
MNDVHAMMTERDGQLVATLLTPDNQAVENVVLFTHLPAPQGMMKIAFYDMAHSRALYYSTNGILDVYAALAAATLIHENTTYPGEKWYALRAELLPKHRYRRELFANEIAKALDDAGVGWLNPIILPDGEGYLFDLALSDEAKGREMVKRVMKRWGAAWELRLKEDGIEG